MPNQSRTGGRGLYMRSLEHLDGSSEAKDRENKQKIVMDQPTDGQTDGHSGV